jgi:uncharacterized protein YyaL (SSP411 family)
MTGLAHGAHSIQRRTPTARGRGQLGRDEKVLTSWDGYRPFQVVALGEPNRQGAVVPLLQDRGMVDGRAAAYVCRDFACQASAMEPEGLRAQLESR